MLAVALVVFGGLAGIALLLAGKLKVDLSVQSSMTFAALLTAVGGVLSVTVRRLQMLRSDERTHLEAMSEREAQQQVWLLGLETKDPHLMREMVSAGVALNRGKAIPGTLTNQHIEQARLEAKLASASGVNPLSPPAALLQEALSERAKKRPRS